MSTSSLNPQILGRAENAHRALLQRALDGTGLSYQQWVALSLIRAEGSDVVGRLMTALKVDAVSAGAVIADLTAADLVRTESSGVHLTDSGAEVHGAVRRSVDAVVADLYRDIPSGDLEVAGRVLVELTNRATAMLAT
jgi:DNA-binding MarR family transcriptional regulator